MKKLLFLAFIIVLLFAIPYILPEMMKKKIFNHLTANIPGTVSVENIQLSWFSETNLTNVTWKHKNTTVKLPFLIIDASLPSLFLQDAFTFHLSGGEAYHQDTLLFDRIKSNPTLKYANKKLSLTNPCSIHAGVVEEGVDAFINHKLIPSFSSQAISLYISEGALDPKLKNSLRLNGTLSLNTLKCSPNQVLTTTLSLLKQKTPSYISIQCGKMPITVQSGIISYEKTPFLIDGTFQVVSAGIVNLISDNIHIKIGLTTNSLIKAFNLTSLPPGYMVPFSIKGTTHNPKIQTAEALKNIAALILLEKINPKNRRYPTVQSF